MDTKNTYTLTDIQLQNLLNFLSKRPYVEVFQLVQMIQSIKPNEIPKSDPIPEPAKE